MVTLTHQPKLKSPYYSGLPEQRGMVLHRYLDDEFLPRFIQAAQSGNLAQTDEQAWRQQDLFGRFKDYPQLRLPSHRAFYIAATEVCCETFGDPAFAPEKIISAGFVIRRQGSTGNQKWLLKNGIAQGWVNLTQGDEEPDENRRLQKLGLVTAKSPEPPYNGEETYPLHSLLVKSSSTGRNRSHTLLYGYVPLGGSHRTTFTGAITAPDEAVDYAGFHPWPFGSKNPQSWSNASANPVNAGRPTLAFCELLASLLLRFHVLDEGLSSANEALNTWLKQIQFKSSASAQATVTHTLFDYLNATESALYEWLAYYQKGADSAGNISTDAEGFLNRRLPGYGDHGELADFLVLTEQQASSVRTALELRTESASTAQLDGLALPRFSQNQEDVYFLVPFIRYHKSEGCEHICWGQPSEYVRVASFFEPEASLPQAIQLPGLEDLKRGVVKGVTFLSPKSLAEKIQELKLNMDFEKQPAGLSACFSFSFSIPAITICAMLILMIVINLLNLLFFWLPWVFIALPRFCLKAELGK